MSRVELPCRNHLTQRTQTQTSTECLHMIIKARPLTFSSAAQDVLLTLMHEIWNMLFSCFSIVSCWVFSFFPVAHGIYLTVAQNVPQLKLHTESCVWAIMIWWHLEYVRLLAVCSNHSLNELEMCLCSSELFECLRHNSTKKGKFLSGCM